MNRASTNSVAAIQEDFNAKDEIVELFFISDMYRQFRYSSRSASSFSFIDKDEFFYGVIQISTNKVVWR